MARLNRREILRLLAAAPTAVAVGKPKSKGFRYLTIGGSGEPLESAHSRRYAQCSFTMGFRVRPHITFEERAFDAKLAEFWTAADQSAAQLRRDEERIIAELFV